MASVNRTTPQARSMKDSKMSTAEMHHRSQLSAFIRRIKFGMLTTLHQNVHLHSQPMTTRNQRVNEDDRLSFFMTRSSGPLSDLLIDRAVNVCFAGPASHSDISGSGEVTPSEMRQRPAACGRHRTVIVLPGDSSAPGFEAGPEPSPHARPPSVGLRWQRRQDHALMALLHFSVPSQAFTQFD